MNDEKQNGEYIVMKLEADLDSQREDDIMEEEHTHEELEESQRDIDDILEASNGEY